MQVFWRKGYEGASLSDLTQAMAINRPSLYAAFGDKQTLFHKVLDRYDSGPAAYVQEALKEPSARGVAERLLQGAADLLSNPCNPHGCLSVQGALACAETADPVREELISRRAAAEAALRRRFKRAKSAGDLPPDADPGELARYLATVAQGMSVQAASGATRKDLLQIVRTALRAWP
jgi:AcrR family transcriptional regulator